MSTLQRIAHWWREQKVKRFERYIQSAIIRYRYDPKPTITGNEAKIINTKGQGALLSYCPVTKHLYYFSHEAIDPALIRLAETMLVINRVSQKDLPICAQSPYVVTMRDLTNQEGPSENGQWLDYMNAIDKLIPEKHYQAVKQAINRLRQDKHLPYALCRIFHVPMDVVRRRMRDSSLNINHQTSFTAGLLQYRDELLHEQQRTPDQRRPASPGKHRRRLW
jgi:hypothetical protein